MEIGNDPSTVFRDADWALLLGAVPRRQGGSSAQLQEALYVLAWGSSVYYTRACIKMPRCTFIN